MSLRNRPTLVSFVALLVSGTVATVLLGYGALVVVGAFLAGTLPTALAQLAFPVLPAFVLATVVAVLSSVGVAYGLAKRAKLPRGGRIEAVARRAENEYPPLRRFGVADAFAERTTPAERREDALASLKRRYVNDEITEREFERKLDRLVANDSVDDARAARERTAVVEDERR